MSKHVSKEKIFAVECGIEVPLTRDELEHLRMCEQCREYAAGEREMESRLRALAERPSKFNREKIQAAIEKAIAEREKGLENPPAPEPG